MRPRFRLRTLLILTAFASVTCYWWVARPTALAGSFAAAVERGDYSLASSMCDQPKMFYFNIHIVSHRWWVKPRPPRRDVVLDSNGQPQVDTWVEAELQPRTWPDFWHGRRRIVLRGVYSDNSIKSKAEALALDADNEFNLNNDMQLVVNRRHVLIPGR